MEQKLFFGGKPTDIDINRLRVSFPDSVLVPGTKIPYRSIEGTIGVAHKTSRWETVTNRWRVLMEHESGIILKPHGGIEFVVCDNTDKLQLSHNKLRQSARCAKRSIQINTHIDRSALTEDEKIRFDQAQKWGAAVIGLETIKHNAPELPTLK